MSKFNRNTVDRRRSLVVAAGMWSRMLQFSLTLADHFNATLPPKTGRTIHLNGPHRALTDLIGDRTVTSSDFVLPHRDAAEP